MNNLLELAKNRWQQCNSREQLTLLVGGCCLLVYLLYIIVLQPLKEMREAEERAASAAQSSLATVRTLAATWQSRNQSTTADGSSASLVEIVDASLRSNDLRLSGLQPSGSDSVRLRLENANFDKLLSWLYEMEVTNGLQIRDLSVAPGNQVGAVAVNLRLQQR